MREAGLSCERLPVCYGLRSIFRWVQDATIPRNPDGFDFLQPVPCAYADDLAVAASFNDRFGSRFSNNGSNHWA